MKVDLSKTVSLTDMRYLIEPETTAEGLAEGLESGTEWHEVELLEDIGGARTVRVLVTKPEALADREGYKPDFLDGWSIPLPNPTDERKADLLKPQDGENNELKYEHFSTAQSKSRRMPMFVAVNIDGTQTRKIPRTSTPWRFDGRLPLVYQIGDEVYYENVLDRGHMVRRESPNWGDIAIARRANIDTFHFTNACPQMERVNRNGKWRDLEDYILTNTRKEVLRVSVFTGPAFTAEDIRYRGALIPKSFWKVVAVVLEDGRPSATAYEISQEKELSKLEGLEFAFGKYKTYQCSIKSIEEKTSLSFGELSHYDGYSVTETEGIAETPIRTELQSLEMIRL